MKEQTKREREIIEVSYCRVSTEQESQTQSFNAQMEHYQKLFKKNNSKVGNCGAIYQNKVLTLTNNGIYADEGISGAKVYRNREAFMRMIEDAKLGLFNKISVKNTMRFSREGGAGEELIKDLSELGVEVYFEEGGLSSFNPTHLLVINMMLQVGQQESRSKSEAIQWGIRRQQEKGKYHGVITPYGYDKNEEGFLMLNLDESQVIKEIFSMYLENGFGTQKIARELNSKNIPTKLNKQWSNKQIGDILSNEIYIGKQITNKINIDATARFTRKEVAEEEQIVNQFNHLIIIDVDMFEMAQDEVKRRSKDWNEKAKKHRPSQVHLLSNLIKCGNCGGGYGRKKRKSYTRKDGTSRALGYEWTCNTNDKYGKDRCKYRNQIIEVDLIEEIKEQLINWKNDTTPILRTKAMYLDLYYNAQSRLSEKKELEERLIKLNNQVQLNFELLSDGIIDKEEYRTRNDLLQSEIKEINEQIKGFSTLNNEIAKVEKDFTNYMKILNSVDVNNFTNFKLKKLIDKIVVETDEKGEKYHYIDWKFLNRNISDIGYDATLKAMQEDHPDKIPPEFRNQKFRI